MLKIMLLIILSPFAILCAIVSMAIIYAILMEIVDMTMDCVEVINDLLNNRDNKQC